VVAAASRGDRRTAALGVTLLVPPLALGIPLGSAAVVPLAALAGAWLCARRGSAALAGACAGLAVAFDHRALLAALPLIFMTEAIREHRQRALAIAAAAYAIGVLPFAMLDPLAFVVRLRSEHAVGPGLGLFNLFAYRGHETSVVARALAALAPLIAVLLAIALTRRAAEAAAAAGLGALIGLILAPSLSAEAVATPILLLLLAYLGAARPGAPAGEESRPPPDGDGGHTAVALP
jgi:hypothetical protein